MVRDAGLKLVFVWARSRRGFLREQFSKNVCDVLVGVPVGMRGVLTTKPYYRSSYVFVTRTRDGLQIATFTDPRLNGRRIGLQILEENLSPPSLPLIRYGHAGDLVGFGSFGSQTGEVVRAVSDGRVGVAVVWGPIAGYFAALGHPSLTVTPLRAAADTAGIPMLYSIALGVHGKDIALRDALSASIEKNRAEILRLLAEYHVPTIPLQEGGL